MIEEVKKILDKQYEEGCHHLDTWSAAYDICQQFPKSPDNPDGYEPKPDEGLLTEEIRDIARRMITASHYNNLPDSEFDNYLNSILAKVASIKDAECQARVDGVLNLFTRSRSLDGSMWWRVMPEEDWQALKEKEAEMRIIRESRLHEMLKEAYRKGINIGYGIGYHARKKEGAIIPGYDMDKDLEEILKRKGCKGG